MADVALLASQVQDAGGGYQIPAAQEIVLKCCTASFDGTSAAGDWLPALQIVAPNGTVMGTFPIATKLAAGALADVSWFPRASGGVGVGGSGIQYDTDNEGDWLTVTTNTTAPHDTDGIVFNANNGGIELGSSDNSGNAGITLDVTGMNDNGILLSAQGSSGQGVQLQAGDDGDILLNQTGAGAIQLVSQVSTKPINIEQDGNGGVTIQDAGSGGVNLKGNGTGSIFLDSATAEILILAAASDIFLSAEPGTFGGTNSEKFVGVSANLRMFGYDTEPAAPIGTPQAMNLYVYYDGANYHLKTVFANGTRVTLASD